MIERYTLPKMGEIWREEHKLELMLKVEVLAAQAMAEEKIIPSAAARRIARKASFNIKKVEEIERTARHDVVAFLTEVQRKIGKDGRFLHYGMTSSDALDTALAVQLTQASDLIIKDLAELARILKSQAQRYKNTLMIGRTHGRHAEPITFGLKLAGWYMETLRNIQRIRQAREIISVGKISGAVGTYAHLTPEVERAVCKKLGLKPAPVSTQIVQRDRHAQYLVTLAIIAASLEKFAMEIRHLQRDEIGEVEEYFISGQKGSSAMPHKHNPIICERICGLARVVKANAQAGLENVSLWQERDISHSSAERIILADSNILVDYITQKFVNISKHLVVYPGRMKENLFRSKGLIFSEGLLLKLIKKGLTRERAYKIVQNIAAESLQEEKDFKKLVSENKQVNKYLSTQEIKQCFELKPYLKNIDQIFARLKI